MSALSPEAELMGRYCRGDAVAFDQLYRSLAPRVLRYLLGLAGERGTAEDLLQQVFLKLHEARQSYVAGAEPGPWVFTIAHRTFLDDLRRKKRGRLQLTADGSLPPEPPLELGADFGLPMPGPDEPLSEAMLAALARLPDPQREALALTALQGHSMAEAAAIVGTTRGAMKLRAHRGVLALRKLLARDLRT